MIKVELKGDLTQGAIVEARAAILDAFSKDAEVGVEVGMITTFDATLPQLLLSAQASARASGKRLLFPGLLNADLVRMAMDLGIARPDEVGDEWPW